MLISLYKRILTQYVLFFTMSRRAFDIDHEFERQDEKMLRLNSDMCVGVLVFTIYAGVMYIIWMHI